MITPGRLTVGHNPHEVKINRFNSITGDNTHPWELLDISNIPILMGVHSHKLFKLWQIKLWQVTVFSNDIDGFVNFITPQVEFLNTFTSFTNLSPAII